jgi:sec-independent protein translocase protein TatA
VNLLAVTMPGGGELVVILLIVLVLFGGAKLPQLARNLGQAQREFKKGVEQEADDDASDTSDKPA